MGAPVETGIENFEEVILGLSKADRVKLLGWIAETLVEEGDPVQEAKYIEWPPKNLNISDSPVPSDETPWYMNIDPPGPHLSTAEWEARVNSVSGLWSDLPDAYGDDIVSSRTISIREVNLDD
ncbi:MAG: hypothetical protein AB8H12_19290 [Lewinella sp.]